MSVKMGVSSLRTALQQGQKVRVASRGLSMCKQSISGAHARREKEGTHTREWTRMGETQGVNLT